MSIYQRYDPGAYLTYKILSHFNGPEPYSPMVLEYRIACGSGPQVDGGQNIYEKSMDWPV